MNMALAASIDDASAISNDGPNDILWRLASPSVPCMGEILLLPNSCSKLETEKRKIDKTNKDEEMEHSGANEAACIS